MLAIYHPDLSQQLSAALRAREGYDREAAELRLALVVLGAVVEADAAGDADPEGRALDLRVVARWLRTAAQHAPQAAQARALDLLADDLGHRPGLDLEAVVGGLRRLLLDVQGLQRLCAEGCEELTLALGRAADLTLLKPAAHCGAQVRHLRRVA